MVSRRIPAIDQDETMQANYCAGKRAITVVFGLFADSQQTEMGA
jgi:hypothetical protein